MWARHDLRTDRLTDEHPLKYLFLEVTRQCNLGCLYCGSECDPRGRQGELTVPEWIEILGQVAEDFDPSDIMVAVTGGEPLIKPDVFELFAELRRLGFPYGMVSNGQLLDANKARELVEIGMGSISLSMDAPPDLNDKLRGKGTSAKVVEAVGHLRSAGFKGKLEIISTVTKPAVARLDEMRRFVAGLRISLWRVAPVMPIGRALLHPDLLPDDRDVRAILEFVREGREDALMPQPEFSEEGFVGQRFEGMVRPYLCQCRAGISIAGIRANGKIAACPELSAAFDQGDIRKERLKGVWDERYEVFRDRSWTHKGPCATCSEYRHCRGGAMHLYDEPGADALRCLYLMCKRAEDEDVCRPAAP